MLIGVWGILRINGPLYWPGAARETPEDNRSIQVNTTQSSHFESERLEIRRDNESQLQTSPLANSEDTTSNFNSIMHLVDNDKALEAAKAINENHSNLSSAELDALKSALITLAFRSNNNKSRTKNTLLATSKAFDDLAVWKYLGDVAVSDNDWNIAFDAYFRASELENNPIELDQLLVKLVASSGHLRTNYEGNGDLLSVKALYQRLSDLHPNFQRFNYELAIANVNLGELENARQLLRSLSYDPELGDVATQVLERISLSTESPVSNDSVASQPQNKNQRESDIVVPLVSAGSSYIVDSNIERQPVRLLLDTGASITSLSSQLIERLNLEPTGQSIRLSTANGITSARIFRVKQLRLGSVTLRDMLIAEINLNNSRRFQGLLGTDALNQLKPQYSYLIDNQQSALIFRKR